MSTRHKTEDTSRTERENVEGGKGGEGPFTVQETTTTTPGKQQDQGLSKQFLPSVAAAMSEQRGEKEKENNDRILPTLAILIITIDISESN